MVIGASLCTLYGVWPDLLYRRLAERAGEAVYNPMVAGERLLGRGILEDDDDDFVERHRLPVGITMLAMLGVFAVVVLAYLMEN